MFDTDVAKYGSVSEAPAEPQATAWMRNLDAHAALVTPKSSSSEKHGATKGKRSRKRARREISAEASEVDEE